MLALFTERAGLDVKTVRYPCAGEVVGRGYTEGGQELQGFICGLTNGTAWATWTANVIWKPATIVARGALIYNASRGNCAVAVLDFKTDRTSTDGEFQVVFPPGDDENAIIRIR